ncbi:MAG: helix-turn-helix domain-containing protein [Culicoidibacterales bacterium]
MDYSVFESMIHPVRMQILQVIIKQEQATTKEISQACSEIPQATLYRNLAKLVKDKIIRVESENQVRGVREKVYAININPYSQIEAVVQANDTTQLLNLFHQFSLSLLHDFQNYQQAETIDLHKDVVGFRSYLLHLDETEAHEFMQEIYGVIAKRANHQKNGKRRLRKFSTVFVPVDAERREQK